MQRLPNSKSYLNTILNVDRVVSVAFHLNLQNESVTECSTEPVCVSPDLSVRNAIEKMKDERRGSVSVCRDGKLVGIFTERDALRLMSKRECVDVPIETVMTHDPATVRETDTVETAIKAMADGGYRRLPIVNADGQPTGLVKVSDILHYLVQHFPEYVYNLPPKPGMSAPTREGA